MLFGTFSEEVMRRVSAVNVRSTENFNWTFIFILAVVFYIYWTEIRAKNFKAVIAGLSLWGLQWFFEICNAMAGRFGPSPTKAPVSSC